MSSKEELSEKLNELLGFKDKPIAFEKLSKDDLIRLYEAIVSLVQTRSQGILDKSIKEILSMRVYDIVREVGRSGGLVGLLTQRDSILARILGKGLIEEKKNVKEG